MSRFVPRHAAMSRMLALAVFLVLGGGTAAAQEVIPIAALQSNPSAYLDSFVTVQGQVTIPTDHIPVGAQSGWIQDDSGRGIHLFGVSANNAAFRDTGNIVQLRGEVKNTSQGLGLTNMTDITTVSTGNARKTSIQLPTGSAPGAAYDGSFLQVNGPILLSTSSGGSRVYDVNDGSGLVKVRVPLAVSSGTIPDNTIITALGVGTSGVMLVGVGSEIFADTLGADTSPPDLVGVFTPLARTTVDVTFSEAVDGTAGNTGNYEVFETATPGNTIAVTGATVSGVGVTLQLATAATKGVAYTVRVSSVQDTAGNAMPSPQSLGFTAPTGDTTPPSLLSATNTSSTSIDATFSENIDPSTGGDAANYEVFVTATPATTVPVTSVSVSGSMSTLTLGSALADGTEYTVRVQDIEDLEGNAMVGTQTANFTTTPGVTTIATIQANPQAFEGQVVTVEGQVYIPSNYIASRTSGYIQDGSGRGINVFGNGANDPALQNTSNIARVTGTVTLFFSTVEIDNITDVTLVSSGNPPLSPQVLSTGAAASSSWEGTFIQSSGTISSIATTGGSAPATNYTINDGSGPLIIRVVDDVMAPSFSVGQTITGRGAGAAFQADFQILVGSGSDVFLGGGGPDVDPPTLVSASGPSSTSVAVTFSERVTTATANVASNYMVTPTMGGAMLPVTSAVLDPGSTVATLTLSSAMTNGTGYTVTVNNVQDEAGNTIASNSTVGFTYTEFTGTPIADIQANPQAFEGQVVTVQGQVYIPSNYIASRTSGYIQDGSGRGINVFGNGANDPALQDTGNIATVTGTVTLFFSTVEIDNITNVTLVSSGNPPLSPQVLTTGAAASSNWEGTFIQSSGPIQSIATTGGSAPATNYTIDDGSGPLIIRVVDDIGAPSFSVGQTITGRGAGAAFQSDFQILIGNAADVFMGGGGPDVDPPTLVGASGPTATTVQVNFSERVTASTANVASNYGVQVTSGATVLPVTSAVLGASATSVTLSLGSSMVNSTNYTVTVSNVQDEAGNTIIPNSGIAFTYTEFSGTSIAEIQANPQAFEGQVVTVQGQVYIPSNYIASRTSGYIQDGSGRGINVFGNGANDAALQDTGNIATVTGTVTLFFSTVEIDNITNVTLVSSGNPPLSPQVLSTGAAASSNWEGTFIQSSGTISSIATTGGSAPATNYTINDGSGPLIIRVVDDIGAPSFSVGQTITGRGAGAAFQSDFQILIGSASEVFTGGGGPDLTPPTISSVFAGTDTQLNVNWSEPVTTATANVTSNYEVFLTSNPGTTIPVTTASTSGPRTSTTLSLGSSLTDGMNYTLRVNGIQDDAGNTIVANSTQAFTYSASTATPIAQIQADPASFEDQVVTIQGQIYIPTNYRGGTPSGYVQDNSGRGINLFGNTANDPRLQDTGNIVEVTGTVAIFFSTIEILDITQITLLSSGNAPLEPTILSTGAAANSNWEGTYIQASGLVLNVEATGGSATNYTIDDGTGPVALRVADDLNADTFQVGDRLVGRGAGSAFQTTFQILIGNAANIAIDTGGGGDQIPPSIDSARSTNGNDVIVTYSEQVEIGTATTISNYDVFQTADTTNAIIVTGATMEPGNQAVKLTLGSSLPSNVLFTVRVNNVEDLAGNVITPNSVTTFKYVQFALSGEPYTFIPRRGEVYPLTISVPVEIQNNGETYLRIFDMTGRLRRTLFDSRFGTTTGVIDWDGRDDRQELVPAGTYIAHLSIVDRITGSRDELQIAVVVATRLNR